MIMLLTTTTTLTNSAPALVYSSAGCACRFLYGPETKDEHKAQVEKSLDGKIELKQEVIFYKKNGKSGVLIKFLIHHPPVESWFCPPLSLYFAGDSLN